LEIKLRTYEIREALDNVGLLGFHFFQPSDGNVDQEAEASKFVVVVNVACVDNAVRGFDAER
jgi:hypothetical protein